MTIDRLLTYSSGGLLVLAARIKRAQRKKSQKEERVINIERKGEKR